MANMRFDQLFNLDSPGASLNPQSLLQFFSLSAITHRTSLNTHSLALSAHRLLFGSWRGPIAPSEPPACVLAGLGVGQELACQIHANCSSRSVPQKRSHYFRQRPEGCYHNSDLDVKAFNVCSFYFRMVLHPVSSILTTVSRWPMS